jgi:FMN phosphatase YigB (HAD superfamily)
MPEGQLKRPKAVLLDLDETLLDNSFVPASVKRACDAIAAVVRPLDPAELLTANTAAWNDYWPEVERLCWVGEMEVLDVSREVWRRALQSCGRDDPAFVDFATRPTRRSAGKCLDSSTMSQASCARCRRRRSPRLS